MKKMIKICRLFFFLNYLMAPFFYGINPIVWISGLTTIILLKIDLDLEKTICNIWKKSSNDLQILFQEENKKFLSFEKDIKDLQLIEEKTRGLAQWLTNCLNSQIQNHYANKFPEVSSRIIKAFPLEIKIGNDEILIDVPYDDYYRDPIETLDKAYSQFLEKINADL